jgi:hypothetical protein
MVLAQRLLWPLHWGQSGLSRAVFRLRVCTHVHAVHGSHPVIQLSSSAFTLDLLCFASEIADTCGPYCWLTDLLQCGFRTLADLASDRLRMYTRADRRAAGSHADSYHATQEWASTTTALCWLSSAAA